MVRLLIMTNRTKSFLRTFRKRDLNGLLERLGKLDDLGAEVVWLKHWVDWLGSGDIPAEASVSSDSRPTARMKYFIETVRRKEAWVQGVQRIFASVLSQTKGLELFCQTGISEEMGFLAELANRMLKRFLPTPRRGGDFSLVFTQVFTQRTDASWILMLQPEAIEGFLGLVSDPQSEGRRFQHLRISVADALLVLSANLVAISQTPEIRRRTDGTRIVESPFYRLNLLIQNLAADISDNRSPSPSCFNDCNSLINDARESLRVLYSQLEESGVSVALVYDVEHQLHRLRRVQTLLTLLITTDKNLFLETLIQFIARLISEHFESQSIRNVISENLHLLSRKIAERSGSTGEHYITRTRREYFKMLNAASGGGFVTVGTAAAKSSILHLGAAPFFEGLFSWLNYSGSFILMQLMGFTLATKQPSMTAATLAGKLGSITPEGLDEFVDEVAMITRSQLAAAMGNLLVAIPIGICADMISQMWHGTHIYSADKAASVISSLDPFHSWAVPSAAITGGFLWLSSISAGWFENWIVCHEIPGSIAHHRQINAIFSKRFSRWLAEGLSRHSGGFAGNVALGFFLGFFPVFCRFFGLPFDVFHVTLSTASLTFACTTLWNYGLANFPVGYAALGIGVILCLNFGVSFLLALFVAAKARKIPGVSPWPIIRPILRGFWRSPGRFFVPIRS